jgi:hypothetical protein
MRILGIKQKTKLDIAKRLEQIHAERKAAKWREVPE